MATTKGASTAPAKDTKDTKADTGTTAEPRKRASISPAKALAIQIAGLVAILNSKPVAAVLTAEQKTQVKAASNSADEMNAKTLKPIQDRIKAISEEFTALMPKITEPGTAETAKELSQELARLQNRLKNLTQTATA